MHTFKKKIHTKVVMTESTKNKKLYQTKGPKMHKCLDCGNGYSSIHSLIRHIDTHVNGKMYICNVCGKQLARFENLKYHMSLHESEENRLRMYPNKYQCPVCEQTFDVSKQLDNHLKVFHVGIKRYHCHICGKGYSHSGDFNIHKRKHTGERPFMCEHCGTSFMSNNALRKHRMSHKDLPHRMLEQLYCCGVCGHKFEKTVSLKNHERSHLNNNVKVKSERICNECGQTFACASSLHEHKKIHSGIKPFGCDICGYRTCKKSNLINHYRIHSGEKPFQCKICGVAYSDKSNLNKHKKQHSHVYDEKDIERLHHQSCRFYSMKNKVDQVYNAAFGQYLIKSGLKIEDHDLDVKNVIKVESDIEDDDYSNFKIEDHELDLKNMIKNESDYDDDDDCDDYKYVFNPNLSIDENLAILQKDNIKIQSYDADDNISDI